MAIQDAIYRAAFDRSAVPIIVVDGRGIPAIWNSAFETLFRSLASVGPERLPGSFFDYLAAHECERFEYFAAEVLLGGWESASVESPIRCADGTRRWIHFTLSLLEAPAIGHIAAGQPDADGASMERYLVCAAQDVSERVLRETRLRDAKEEAEKATHTKSQFLANMSHEIRTPIQTILGVVELLQETSLDTEQSEYASQVRFSADVLLGIINDILDFSKIEAGKFELETMSFDLRACVHQSVDMLVMDAHRKGLEILVDIDDSLPSLVRGDPGRLRQIIVNLFKNAVKFTREGGIFLTLRREEDEQGERMRFEVADTGPGVPEDVRDRLFTPFFQGDFAQARKTGGTGLGLAISRHLAQLMGGTIGLRPNEPGGSVFWFELPLVAPEYSAAPISALRASLSPSQPGGARVLVVDDHDAARAFSMAIASRAGYRVAEAASGEEALAALRAAAAEGDAFAVCLIDQNMPKMDGWRLASEITGDTAINSARLVLMAPVGTIGADAKMKLLRWFNGYIMKPVKPEELLDAVAKALSSEVDLEPAEPEEPVKPEAGAERFQGEVLVAEDHEVNRELFSVLLDRLGCKATAARDGLEAVEIGSAKRFDLVLMDIIMPRMNGYEATRALRERGYRGPIVAVTASALKGEREKCIEAGMDDILVKPFKKRDLAQVLATWLPREEDGAGCEEAAGAAGDGPESEATPCDDVAHRAQSLPDPRVFDWEGVLDTFLGQAATVSGLLVRFIGKARGQLDELERALAAKDFPLFRETAHSMKGASWNLSARRLGDAALAAENAGSAGDADAARDALELVRAAFDEFAAAAAPYSSGTTST
jgi:two-component system sensor histidine kinase/response regulator